MVPIIKNDYEFFMLRNGEIMVRSSPLHWRVVNNFHVDYDLGIDSMKDLTNRMFVINLGFISSFNIELDFYYHPMDNILNLNGLKMQCSFHAATKIVYNIVKTSAPEELDDLIHTIYFSMDHLIKKWK